jgi:hypothetical protein
VSSRWAPSRPKSGLPTCQNPGQCGVDGRVYNEQVYNGVATDGSAGYLTLTIPAANVDETDLAEWLSSGQGANVGLLMTEFGEFTLPFSPNGSQTVGGVSYGQPFCEDFNEFAICGVALPNTKAALRTRRSRARSSARFRRTPRHSAATAPSTSTRIAIRTASPVVLRCFPPPRVPTGPAVHAGSACRCSLF